MDEDLSDEALMTAYAEGHPDAFETLYARHRTGLFRFVYRQVRTAPLAEDIFQDIWQRVIVARRRFRADARFVSWLYTIAHNRLNDHWRAQRHRPEAPTDAEQRTAAIAADDDPERSLSQFEQLRRLQLALEALPPEQREIVIMRLEQGFSMEEIAEITGVGRETVKSRLRYALDKLRERVRT